VALVLRAVFLLALLSPFAAFSEGLAPKISRIDPPKRMLFIGNSFTYFNNGLPRHVIALAEAADKDNASAYEFRMATISGAYLTPLEPILPGALKADHPWDIVVLQGQSTEPMDTEKSEKFRSAVRSLDKTVRESGARTVLFITWPYKGKPEMTDLLAKGYISSANEVGALAVPVGLAFDRLSRDNPAINLYFIDGKHPSMEGTYLAACVFYAALFGKSPEGNSYVAGIDPDRATVLQKAAWSSVRDFYGR
jgi:hypothetical protein